MAVDRRRPTIDLTSGTTQEAAMFTHPDLLWDQTKQHQRDLIAAADAYRLLAHARRSRRGRRGTASAADKGVARGRPAGNLAPCGPRAAAPAR
jgi:hypothetical protein